MLNLDRWRISYAQEANTFPLKQNCRADKANKLVVDESYPTKIYPVNCIESIDN